MHAYSAISAHTNLAVAAFRADVLAHFRRLARDYERLATTLAGFHFLAFLYLMLHHFIHLTSSP